MPKLTDSELKAIIDAEKADALASVQSSTLTAERERAQRYYLGDVSGDLPAQDGRSRAVSTDVADTIDGLMPDLMEIFTGGDEVVKFQPVGPEDVQAAQQETDYVNHVFMEKNPGFLVLYSFIKDALLSKLGVVKVWTEEEERETRTTYSDLPPDQYAILISDPDIEPVEHTEHDGLHDVTVVNRKTYKCHRVASVPPEEFGISRSARTVQDAGYAFHETVDRTEASLIADGYDGDQIRSIPTWTGSTQNLEQMARDSVDEGQQGTGSDSTNVANRRLMITEHFLRVDYLGDGKPRLYRIVTGGNAGSSQILEKGGKPDITEINRIPMAAMTPVIITHRLIGRSIADLVIDLMQIKTVLLRALLDNTYMAVNPRPEVAEATSSPDTLDDLLISKPGRPIRVKQAGTVNWQQVPFVAGDLLPIMQFLDALREWKTGVSRQGQGVDPNALQNQVATIANQMQDASSRKIKMIARIFAETGVKDLFSLLHAEIRENGDEAQVVRLRNQWVPVDPSEWKERDDMTINVALGTGSKAEELAKIQLRIQAQVQGIQAGIVSRENLFNSAKDLVRVTGGRDVDMYFVDPNAPPDPNNPNAAPIPPPSNPDEMKAQQQMAANQQQFQLEQQKAQADTQHQAAKAQSDIAIANQKFELEKQLKLLDAEIAARKHQMEMEKGAQQMALQANKPAKASIEVKHGAEQLTQPMADIVSTLGQHLANTLNEHTKAITTVLAQHSAPKRIRKHPDGSFTTEPVTH